METTAFRVMVIGALCLFSACGGGMSKDELRAYVDEVNNVAPDDQVKRELLRNGRLEVAVDETTIAGGRIHVVATVRNGYSAPVRGVAVNLMTWGRNGQWMARRISAQPRIDVEIPSGRSAAITVEGSTPATMPVSIEFVTVTAAPIHLGPHAVAGDHPFLDAEGDEIYGAKEYTARANVGVGFPRSDRAEGLEVTTGDFASAGQVLKIRGKVRNLYSEEVRGVRYRVRFLERAAAEARVLDSVEVVRKDTRLAPQEEKLVSIDVESMYVAMGAAGVQIDAIPITLDGRVLPLPEGW